MAHYLYLLLLTKLILLKVCCITLKYFYLMKIIPFENLREFLNIPGAKHSPFSGYWPALRLFHNLCSSEIGCE